MSKIVLLPDELSNKIAAGEVVERPASVVKELVENAIDAGSSWIKLELEEAGMRLIKVTDDGEGMSETDCEKAFYRHATSKIKNEQQLFRVETLGFRGEALASIAGVSQLTLRTSTGDEAGTELVLHGGKLISKQKHTKRRGTEIAVEHLFYNTPARLKYLKTVHTELGHVMDIINRMALSHPDIRFECYHNDKRVFQSPGSGKLLQVIQQIYGQKIAANMLPISNESLDYKIGGFIGKPEVTRSNRSYMTLIVNGRYIKNFAINKAIIDGYHKLLPIGRQPIVVLTIEMDPYLIDVNVHPSKTEVRFSKEKELYEVVRSCVYDTLHREELIPTMAQKAEEKAEQTALDFGYKATMNNTETDTTERKTYQPPTKESGVESIFESAFERMEKGLSEPPIKNKETEVSQPSIETAMETKSRELPRLYPIGQLQGTYILAQNEQGFYMVDQHAAQERIKYEFYKEQLSRPDQEVQELAVPLHFELTNQEAAIVEAHKEEFQAVGLYFEPFGDNSFLVRSYPTWFPAGEEEQLIHDMVDELVSGSSIDIGKMREETAILMSCKRSIKANHYLNHDEMSYLLEDLGKCEEPYTCPHGRPVIVKFTYYEIEKMFKRVM